MYKLQFVWYRPKTSICPPAPVRLRPTPPFRPTFFGPPAPGTGPTWPLSWAECPHLCAVTRLIMLVLRHVDPAPRTQASDLRFPGGKTQDPCQVAAWITEAGPLW